MRLYLNKFINNFNNLSLVLRKFFLSRILGKKYIREGKCKNCGRCCQGIFVRHSSNFIKDEEEFERLKTQHFFYTYLNVVDKNEIGLLFECTKHDKETGLCTAYKKRALLCKKYPQEEIFMLGGELYDGCGYSFAPIISFDDVFKKVVKQAK